MYLSKKPFPPRWWGVLGVTGAWLADCPKPSTLNPKPKTRGAGGGGGVESFRAFATI